MKECVERIKHFAGYVNKNTNSWEVIDLCPITSRINLEEITDRRGIWCRITPAPRFLAGTSTFGDSTVGTVTTVDIRKAVASCTL